MHANYLVNIEARRVKVRDLTLSEIQGLITFLSISILKFTKDICNHQMISIFKFLLVEKLEYFNKTTTIPEGLSRKVNNSLLKFVDHIVGLTRMDHIYIEKKFIHFT